MSGGVALQALISGVASGSVYALVALGFTLVYRLTRVFAFAHGDIVVVAAFIGVLALVGTTPVASPAGPVLSIGLVLLILGTGAALSAATYAVAIRPYLTGATHRSGSVVGWAAAGIAVGVALRAGLGLAFTRSGYAVPDPLHLSALTSSGVVTLPGGGLLPVRVFGVLVIGLALAVVAQVVLVRGRFGLALRAASDDPQTAALLGVPVERVIVLAFIAAGLLAAIAGILAAPAQPTAVDRGVLLGLAGAAAAVAGRLGSLGGALVAGVALGVAQEYVVAWPHLGAAYTDIVPLAVLIVALVARPADVPSIEGEPA